MKRIQVFALTLLLAMGMFAVSAPYAYASEMSDADPIVASDGDNPEPTEEPGWHEDEIGYYYILEDGTRATGLLELDEGTYFLNDEGYRVADAWQEIDGKHYHFDADGLMQKDAFIEDGGVTYYVDANGALVSDNWAKIGGKWYRFDASGAMQSDTFIEDSGYTFYLGTDGAMKTGWFQIGTDWYYANGSGVLYKSQWVKSGSDWYWLGDDFKMVFDTYIVYQGSIYAFKPNGAMYVGWFQSGDDWYYAGSNGKLYRNQTLYYKGTSYYFGSDCIARSLGGSWVSYNGNWYFRFSDGNYATGWQEIGGKWYYFSGSAFLFTSRWIKSGGNFYYVGSNGAMYVNAKTPDGSTVNASGKRVSGPSDTKAQGYSSSTGYLILVNYTTHTMSIYTGSRNNWKINQLYPVSMGKDSTKTPTGTFYTTGRTYSFGDSDHTCYYATGFIGMNYLLHSVLYYPGTWTIKDGRLGVNISNGCIRLFTEDAKWIYNNVPLGTPVVIYY